ncbi:MAG: hypothetical protein KKB81_06705 [Candidatus Margulisbacteria bacterium]|nr:hypothetical protein [Candidatus Margulisiibacteriota bacterium]MBU1022487.1 hypothetical protein [Candidatus Margulisiibacteriota bacterium]MBU1728471.1 hypothetical protein [Candidatus Margulisiibacteriota bacterium]MBU1954618.1 hypothetical protein [Candidatus Margulisiibacteriota bacterium]
MKKSLVILIVLVSLFCFVGTASAAEFLGLWTDFWNYGAFRSTSFERNSFSTTLLRSEGKVGVNLIPVWGDTFLSPYVVYSAYFSPDPNYWNNVIYSGYGIRLKPFASAEHKTFISEIKVFFETMRASYIKDEVSAMTANRSMEDTLYGLDLYYEWNQPQFAGDTHTDFGVPWGELWTNLAFRQTNFYQDDFNSYLYRLEPKFGLYVGASDKNPPWIEPYLAGEFVMSGRNYSWLNRAAYGVGLRVQPFRYVDMTMQPWMFKFKMFVEGWGVSYFKAQPTNNVNTDIRLGILFTVGR